MTNGEISPEVGDTLVQSSIPEEFCAKPKSYRERIRKFAKATLLATSLSATAGTVGIIGASLDSSEVMLGPHRAEVELSTSGYITVDGGVTGPVRLPARDSLFGADISVKEIPTQTESPTGTIPSFKDLQGELSPEQLEQFASLYAGISSDSKELKQALQLQFLKYSALGGIGIGAAYRVIGRERWKTLGNKKQLATACALLYLLSGTGIQAHNGHDVEWLSTGAAFKGTTFEGLEVRGELLRLAVPGIRQVIEYFEENDEFYDKARENIKKTAEEEYLLRKQEGLIPFVFITDQHCNVGMNRVIQALAEEVDARILFNGGDATFSGTDIEGYCLEKLAILGENIAIIGNHDDTITTKKQFENNGFVVLNNRKYTANGISVYGDSDPRRSIFGQTTFNRRDETEEQMGERLKKDTCSLLPDIILVHDKAAGLPSLIDGCTNVVIAGHSHRFESEHFTRPDGSTGVYINGGSSGGASKDSPTVGPLRAPATLTIGHLDPKTGLMRRYRAVTINEDADVELGPVQVINRN